MGLSRRHAALGGALLLALSCVEEDPPEPCPGSIGTTREQPLRVFHDPYAAVDWGSDRRLLTQLHDHIQVEPGRIEAYDAAGYAAVPLFHYSGVPGHPTAWTELRWPPLDWLEVEFVEGLEHIETFFPGAEQAGYGHVVSLFFYDYIERWDPDRDPVKLEHHYESTQEAIDRVHDGGGYVSLAHPWSYSSNELAELVNIDAVEMYSAYGSWLDLDAPPGEAGLNRRLLSIWDELLARDPTLHGVAVNDWVGPDCLAGGCDEHPEIFDSGKVELLAPTSDIADLRAALEAGAFLAIGDVGADKPGYPELARILVEAESHLQIDLADDLGGGLDDGVGVEVRWISHGEVVSSRPQLYLSELHAGARYVRAEVTNAGGSTVWTQAFALAPVGDIDGDGCIDEGDSIACAAIVNGEDDHPDRRAAAAAAGCL